MRLPGNSLAVTGAIACTVSKHGRPAGWSEVSILGGKHASTTLHVPGDGIECILNVNSIGLTQQVALKTVPAALEATHQGRLCCGLANDLDV